MALAVGLGVALGGCGRGFQDRPPGTVHPDEICSPGGTASVTKSTGCPPCSSPVEGSGGACADRWYATGFRCTAPGDGRCEPQGGACVSGWCVFRDADGNGIDDALEEEVARRNLPDVVFDPSEQCQGPHAIVYSVQRHPQRPERLAVSYVVLYEQDCGDVNGHLGDDEGFAITVDLDALPGPAATVGLITVAHRHTACEAVSTCEAAPGTRACAPVGRARTRVLSSRDKHANYISTDACYLTCFDRCSDQGPIDAAMAALDVGTAAGPLTHDLTSAGLIPEGAGWDPRLLHFDPWSVGVFGDAGHVADQLATIVAPPGM